MRCLVLFSLLALETACVSGLDPAPDNGSPPGRNVGEPFPTDRGDDGARMPGKYKGLWLRLADNGSPSVIPLDEDEVVGVVCIEMSDASGECADFIARITSHWASEVASAVRWVNCSRSEFGIEHWIDPAYDTDLWDVCLQEAIPYLSLRTEQIRVAYHQAANRRTAYAAGTPRPAYPGPDSNYDALYRNLTAFSERMRSFFPNLQAVYVSSRSYGGFATEGGRSEPLNYEEGHAVNSWLEAHPRVHGVWYVWGAYSWAPPCPTGIFNGAGICYTRSDFTPGGESLSAAGRGKISWQTHRRLLLEAWYRR